VNGNKEEMMDCKFQVQTKIAKPITAVFDAIVNPEKLSGYFTQRSTGPLVEGAKVTWRFAEFDGDVPVSVQQVIPNRLIVFEWPARDADYSTRVEIAFESLDANTTLVKISESGWRPDENGLTSSYLNCHGWTQMSCCLKGYLEYGINLRKGFY
jgi:uncharacterized protein YndB with AHSA1/START domain